MSAWWSRTPDGVKKHDGRKSKLAATIRLNLAGTMGGYPIESLGLYRRDPEKHPDEPNALPGMIAKEESKRLGAEIRAIMKSDRKADGR